MRNIITKYSLTYFFIFFFCSFLFSQDIIITKDSRKIEGRITEVGVENVKYKPIDIPTVDYVIPIAQISSIVFENGKVELFNNKAATAPENKGTTITKKNLGSPIKNYSDIHVPTIKKQPKETKSSNILISKEDIHLCYDNPKLKSIKLNTDGTLVENKIKLSGKELNNLYRETCPYAYELNKKARRRTGWAIALTCIAWADIIIAMINIDNDSAFLNCAEATVLCAVALPLSISGYRKSKEAKSFFVNSCIY